MSFGNYGANPTGGAGFGGFANSGASFFGSSGGSSNTGGIFANAPSVSLAAAAPSGSHRGALAGRGVGRGQRGGPTAPSRQPQGIGRGVTSDAITRSQGRPQPERGIGLAGPAIQGNFQSQTQLLMPGRSAGIRQPQSQGRHTPNNTHQPQRQQLQKQTHGPGGSQTRKVPRSLERGTQNESTLSISSQRDSSMQDDSIIRQQQEPQPRRQQNQSHSQVPQHAQTSLPSLALGQPTSDVSMRSQRTPSKRDVPASLQRLPSSGPGQQQLQQTQQSLQKGPAQGGQSYLSSRSMTPHLYNPQVKPQPAEIPSQQHIPKQPTTSSKPSSSTQKPQAAQATPPNSGKSQKPPIDDEEDLDEYDEEYYGEEGEEDYYGEEDFGQEDAQEKIAIAQQSVQPRETFTSAGGKKNPTFEELQLMQAFKKVKPEAGKLCLYYVTDSCTYSSNCKNKHDQALKDELKAYLQMQRDKFQVSQPKAPHSKVLSQTPVASSSTPPSLPRPKEVAEEKPKKDLRAMLNNERTGVTLPQQEVKVEEEKKQTNQPLPAPKKTLATLGSKKQMPKQQGPLRENFGTLDSMLTLQKPPSLSRQQSSSTLTSTIIKEKMKSYMNYWRSPENFEIPDKAKCLRMCPDEEIYQREIVEQSSINPFERDENGKNFDVLAIKSYQRSAADTMSSANMVRPPQVLFKTVEYLRDCIVDLDRLQDDRNPYFNEKGNRTAPSFQDVYSFLRDRARAIQKDFVVIAKPCCEFKIKSLEQLTRYFIAVFHDSFTDRIELKQHVDRINENLTNLISCYQDVRYNYPDERDQFRQKCLKNEAEFRCYQILNFGGNAIELAKLIETDELLSIRDPLSKALIKSAIDLASGVDKVNTPLFFSRLRREKNYLFCCMMLRFLNQKRQDLVHQMAGASRKDEGVDLTFAAKMLMFEDIEEACSFIEVCGYTEFRKGRYLQENKIHSDDAELKQQFLKWSQESRLSFMDSLRGSRSRCQIMQASALDLFKQYPLDSPPSTSYVKIPTTPLFGIKGAHTSISADSKSEEDQSDASSNLLRQRRLGELISQQMDEPKSVQEDTALALQNLQKEEKRAKESEEAARKKADEVAKIAAEKVIQEKAEREKREREEEERKQQEALMATKKAVEAIARKRKQCRDWFEMLEFKFKQKKNKLVLNGLRQFTRDFKPLLKRKMRSISTTFGASDQNEIESEAYFDLVIGQLPTLDLQKRVSSCYENIQFKSKICPKLYGPQNYEMPSLVNQIFKDALEKGLFKAKLFYHPANTEGSSHDNLMYLQKIFDDSQKPKNDYKIQYYFEKFQLSTQASQKQGFNLDKKLMQEFMGNNLIVVFSSQKSVQSDLAKVKGALELCPPFSRFSMLWIFNRQLSAESQKTMQSILGENLIKDGLLNDLKREALSSLRVVNTYCTFSSGDLSQSPLKKLKSTTFGGKSYTYVDPKNLLLSFILHDLQASIKACHSFPISMVLSSQVKLSDVLRTVAPDSVDLAEGKDPKVIMRKVLKQVLKAISTVEQGKEAPKDRLREEIKKGELQVLNLLLQVSQQQTLVIMEAIKQSVQQRVQQEQFSQENYSAIENSILIYERLSQFSKISPFNLANTDDREVLMNKVQSIMISHLQDIIDDNSINHIKKSIKDIYLYDSTNANSPDDFTYRGGRLFAALFNPIWTALSFSTSTIDPVSALPLNPKTLMSFLSEATHEHITPTQSVPVESQFPTSSTYTVGTLGKRSAVDQLQEELKHELSQSRFANKRRHIEAQDALGFLKARMEVNERIADSPPPQITRVREAVELAMKRSEEATKMKVSDHLKNLSKIDAELKAARKRPAKK